ncbi:hypothetical protein BN2497_3839 [Janthinobacterium sp. CG23_2]|nr:hypothetical protein BN2497_3839 [Janthinobacterium sp. CG23_2]CUU28317.1 hypothetical protein BN3177_3839 [Janthinobacterium sp. CG23_2]
MQVNVRAPAFVCATVDVAIAVEVNCVVDLVRRICETHREFGAARGAVTKRLLGVLRHGPLAQLSQARCRRPKRQPDGLAAGGCGEGRNRLGDPRIGLVEAAVAARGTKVLTEFLYTSDVCRIAGQFGGADSGNQSFLGVAYIRDGDTGECDLAALFHPLLWLRMAWVGFLVCSFRLGGGNGGECCVCHEMASASTVGKIRIRRGIIFRETSHAEFDFSFHAGRGRGRGRASYSTPTRPAWYSCRRNRRRDDRRHLGRRSLTTSCWTRRAAEVAGRKNAPRISPRGLESISHFILLAVPRASRLRQRLPAGSSSSSYVDVPQRHSALSNHVRHHRPRLP